MSLATIAKLRICVSLTFLECEEVNNFVAPFLKDKIVCLFFDFRGIGNSVEYSFPNGPWSRGVRRFSVLVEKFQRLCRSLLFNASHANIALHGL